MVPMKLYNIQTMKSPERVRHPIEEAVSILKQNCILADFNEDDISRRNTIAKLLAEWDLVDVVSEQQIVPADSMSSIKVIPFSQKSEWELVAKYNIGKKK